MADATANLAVKQQAVLSAVLESSPQEDSDTIRQGRLQAAVPKVNLSVNRKMLGQFKALQPCIKDLAQLQAEKKRIEVRSYCLSSPSIDLH